MFLDTVNPELLNGTNTAEKLAVLPYAKWEHFPHSTICHHGTACCETAREWLLAMDFSQLSGGSVLTGPRWIRARYDWGPSKHPIHWCEAVKRKTLDCGVLAAMAQECFTARGVTSYPAQLVQLYSKDATTHWGHKWKAEDDTSTHWIDDELIYHEGCAVFTEDGSIRLWDASAAWWVNAVPTAGYGSLVALKIIAPSTAGPLRWGALDVTVCAWQRI